MNFSTNRFFRNLILLSLGLVCFWAGYLGRMWDEKECIPEPQKVELSVEQKAVATYIIKRYQVSQYAAEKYVSYAHIVGTTKTLDPNLILAVMAVESRFNPVAVSKSNAHGLMQIIPKWHDNHITVIGGVTNLLDPFKNIWVGTQILKDYIKQTRSIDKGLMMYNGTTKNHYPNLVLRERNHLTYISKHAKLIHEEHRLKELLAYGQ